MKSSTIRLLLVLSGILSVGILVTQTFWVRRAYALREREFNISVNSALTATAQDVARLTNTAQPAPMTVERIRPDLYAVQTNTFVEQSVLEHFLVKNLSRYGVTTDFQYALGGCSSTGGVRYAGYVHPPGSVDDAVQPPAPQSLKRDNFYFTVQFLHRSAFASSGLSLWILSTVALLGILSFLVYLLFLVFRQRRLSEVQKDFVQNMTHEFKTPLSTIQLAAEVLKNPATQSNPNRMLNYANIVAAESAALTAHVERVLHTSKAETGELPMQPQPFIWQELLRDVVHSFQESVDARDGTLWLHMPDAPLHYTGDVTHLKATVGNLVDNALKYCDGAPGIHVFLKKQQGNVVISVHDNGIGIKPEHLKMLFKKFYRVPTGNVHDVKGFGLGLNYVRVIVRAHGGTVDCVSRPGHGTTFTMSFPLS